MAKADIRQYLELTQEPYYPDNGCEVATACLSCPLSRCKHDDPEWYTAIRNIGRSLQLYAEMQRDHLSITAAAFRFGMKPRSICHLKARVREAIGEGLDLTDQDLRILASLPPTRRP